MSQTSGIISISHQQFGISITHPLHSTHFPYSSIGVPLGNHFLHLPHTCQLVPWKNCSISGPSTVGGPRLNSASSSSLHRGLCNGEWVGLLSGTAWWCLQLCPQDLLFHWSLIWDGVQASRQPLVRDWLSHSIFSSRATVVARALLWAFLTSPSWVLAKVPPLSPHGVLFCVG